MDAGSSHRPRGIFAAVLTPLTQALEPDTSLFGAHCRWLIDQGCDGLVPLGTTGEGNSLSVKQRLRLIESCTQTGVPMAQFIIGSGSCALADAVEVARAAVGAGAAGVLVLPAFYYKEPSEDGLFGFYSEIIERVGDRRLRVYLYHFPQLSTVPITVPLIKRLIAAYPETISGLKDSSGDWSYSANLIEQFPALDIFSGNEQYLLANLRAGGAGCISANVNVSARLARAVYVAVREGQAAERTQEELDGVRIVLQEYPIPAALKHLMSVITGNRGWENILPPNQPLSADQSRRLTLGLSALPQMKAILGKQV
jgi:4-hydroxy-tetrahydrodipicolinate synthase